ncbi:histidinol dehydrogenase [Gordonia polyisoprenivorans NBRC 16320 = JCM 10675]|uniref:Histidinol dehydrogenase n=1 Tax=Gordonia polyisoprenivorans TaxID=84595 RepID=A0A846WER6_9ACTN|nr:MULTISPECIES: histidinol dehydrogenase [Gordonia]MBE7191735.1 histidinol dehydrogenase [Gordonia polyisoprenivorans]MDF3283979.1 histidinol dehydrogenase [Gordonia sp. N1V]NKY00305.1 histidinol dehydrogenase [Gordonia polyisoprenivorans]OZC33956.1 histidinol dehydrogenase [Gordonia polyisoprenivorans]UZF57415.1 histidinol dehydrogenase [Gordonia polyisoprenivorans]
MKFTPARLAELDGRFRFIKQPELDRPAAQRDPKVIETVSTMLSSIEKGGIDAVRRYAADLDGYDAPDFLVSAADLAAAGESLPTELRTALELGSERTKAFARESRSHLVDFEIQLAEGLVTGQRYVPISRVGAYVPAGRFPLLAGAFMTVGVAKVADVPTVVACTPPRRDGTADPAVLYSAYLSGADQVFVLGGVQALAAMAFGLLGDHPVDMIVGAGNAYVAEAKRQLFGTVAIDLLAGPSEVAVIADETADAATVAADLLGQAEHGTESPAALVTTSEELAHEVIAQVQAQLAELKTAEIAGPAWRDHGSVTWAQDRETAIALMDDLAPEHLEIQTADDDYYHDNLRNYGSIFLGPWSTVAYSDKGMAGTNHVLPTAGGARHSAGLSVSRYLKPLTYQRVSREATPSAAGAVETIAHYEGMAAHEATATIRLNAWRGSAAK